mmetsp:Transcript_23133/g.38064  ORF Transcript_23133/g.38064 Transcript_23133/m.38064 type:complete len:93 (+) Transcript_23133:207-485(+)
MDCPKCQSPYKTPKLLPDCGHVLCLACLRGLESEQCPFCDEKFSSPRGTFPTDLMLEGILDCAILAYRPDTLRSLLKSTCINLPEAITTRDI